jgi:DNA (cytosine-5)-methyltransferase 1
MRYLSVCSGIEAASVAWHSLGWEPVAFSEIEPFPSAVLAHRFPNIPNYGDMTQHATWPIEPGSIDLLVGGTPCQSFSVAGLRKGLHDPRGGLMLTYLEIAARLRPRWIVWENVPGVLSSAGGRDFGSFLGALGELGYGWAYRVLDAQWVRTQRHPGAVPQRRRRVFVVGCLGDWERAAKVLLESESVQRDSPKKRASGKNIAADAEGGAASGGWMPNNPGVVSSVCTKWSKGTGGPSGSEHFNLVAQPIGYRWQNNETGLVQDGTAPSCRASTGSSGFHEMNHPVVLQPFTKAKRAQSVTDDETWVQGQVNPTLSLFDQGDTRATTAVVNMQGSKSNACVSTDGTSFTLNAMHGHDVHAVAVGVDCYNGAVTGDVAATMGTPGSSVNASGPTVMQAVAFKPGQSAAARTIGAQEEVACTVEAGGGGNNKQAVAFQQNQIGEVRCGNISGTINTNSNASGRNTPMAMQAMTVRRLTPRECERLQGFPDDWTLIPWRGKPADQCPDGPRYKALGNSMAVNCMEWIGERIDMIEKRNSPGV